MNEDFFYLKKSPLFYNLCELVDNEWMRKEKQRMQ